MPSDETRPDESFVKRLQEYHRAIDGEDIEGATDAVRDIFAHAEQWAHDNPSLSLDLTIKAKEFEDRAEWDAAEAAYNRILSIPDLEPFNELKAHSDLAALYRLLHRDSDALDHARCATAAARRADMPILLSMALHGEARCLIRSGQINEAGDVISEAISAIDDDKMYNQMRARMLSLRAECATRNGAITEAEQDLKQAYRLLEPLAGMDIAAGVQSDLFRWWSVKARLRTECNDRDGAIAAWQRAVDISKHVASLPHADKVYANVNVADMLKGLANALLGCDRFEDAAAAVDERKEILECVGVFEDDAE